MNGCAEHELDELEIEDAEVVKEPEGLLVTSDTEFCDGPVVHGAAVQIVVGIVKVDRDGPGRGGKGGGGGGKGNPDLPAHGTLQDVKREKMQVRTLMAISHKFPQVSVHNGPMHFQVQSGKITAPPSMCLVLYVSVAVYDSDVVLESWFVIGQPVIWLHGVGSTVVGQMPGGSECKMLDLEVVTGQIQPSPQLEPDGLLE